MVHFQTYSSCSCASEGSVTPGLCAASCQYLIPYAIVYFLMAFIGLSGRVPAILLQLRLVQDENKTLALGMVSFFVNVLGEYYHMFC